MSKENLHFGGRSKEVYFLFCVAVFAERNRNHVLRVSIEFFRSRFLCVIVDEGVA